MCSRDPLAEDLFDVVDAGAGWLESYWDVLALRLRERGWRNVEERLPYRSIGYTAEECERDMRRLTNGERGCSNPDEHDECRPTTHMHWRQSEDPAPQDLG